MTRSPVPRALLDLADPCPGATDERILHRLCTEARLLIGGHLADLEPVPDEAEFAIFLAASAHEAAEKAGRQLDEALAVMIGRAAASTVYARLPDPDFRSELAGLYELCRALLVGGDEGGSPDRN